ncbi:MAG: 3-oxoacyl-[acyl-carrier-protein] reductase [Armatimonadetes bacterium]|nr:3-oxoacyl-[acyl-carrier-protein] reductase [Armatimonadota bacterium]NIM23590.1 3-oxoacyl-[acyl-carrier-protein] reductase [Armatimonadota bacterium]NIM67456.1 3-oxoacyl-[acyl-carrier-protein] reductase [Armatimonadota bacterium]NIM75953.1 3-oxoacyl-[acyl-carrier-protein] reductase [Armatimonadota bacterium]NIN05642.1 3-oxoacyl-[acyl-carrier-protein] reductase [Armatimonadota bacterium]
MKDLPLQTKTALVTGARRGLGKAIALRLARSGADVVLNDIAAGQEECEGVAEEIRALGRKGLVATADVCAADQINEVMEKIVSECGRLDILVNNAGITRDMLLARMTEEQWDSVLNVNLKGTFLCTRAALKTMLKQRSGSIINIASVVGLMGNAGQANYAASKGGVIAFTKAVAKEVASRNIRVNAVAPGFIISPMTDKLSEEARRRLLCLIPLARLGKPEEVAEVVNFLAGDASAYITGQVVNVDGGMVM